ncbi:Qat anti-phage system QueC-like protein QatC [uncultured Microscilla sp.]|uniref:Qat anti-phage system QueC-like protein QatC n=1 Tax=uncultured Microscilla sp. TaxID=432653 RepID=UPI002629E1B9|nr:Qat anti-phage system QueC-like protein QatC [uncultured Microscilla sp.]
MIWNIIYSINQDESYDIAEIDGRSKTLHIPFNRELEADVLKQDIFTKLKKQKLRPSALAKDFLHIGLSIYATDQIVSRSKYGYFNWSRSFIVHVPVSNPNIWQEYKQTLEEATSFLSGDEWKFEFREIEEVESIIEEITPIKKHDFDKACLFSGGMDSFIGASDLLHQRNKLFLVGHHKQGSKEKPTQEALFNEFTKKYANKIDKFLFYVQPKRRKSKQPLSKGGSENTSRARSFLFIATGIAVANAIGEKTPLVVPENGFISLNIPLTSSRLGSLSTRTTHPYFIHKINELLANVGIANKLENPYQFKTKGQMLEEAKDDQFVTSNLAKTISCAHPDIGRYRKKAGIPHCGYCTPCIIRIAAISSVLKKQKVESYLVSVMSETPDYKKKSWRDYRAFTLALHNYNKEWEAKKLLGLKVLSAGPIPDLENLDKYIDVYKNGMKEVGDFLGIKIETER